MNTRKPRYQAILDSDADVRRWYADLVVGSKQTAHGYAKVLERFLRHLDTTPSAFLAQDDKAREDALLDYIQHLIGRGLAPSHIDTTQYALMSWLKWNRLPVQRRAKVPKAGYNPKVRAGHNLTTEELRRIIDAAGVRERVVIAFMAYAGLRPMTLGMKTDGLRFGDLPDCRIEDGRLVFNQVPMRVVVREEISKGRIPYQTMMGPEGCGYLAAYVEARLAKGEKIDAKSAVLAPVKNAFNPFIVSENVGDVVRGPMRRAGVGLMPYALRSYFSSACLVASTKGMSSEWREFMMGHTGGIAATYNVRKGLTPEMEDQLRAAYMAALPSLEVSPGRGDEDVRHLGYEALLEAVGYDSEDLARMDLASMTPDELVELARNAPKAVTVVGRLPEGAPRTRIVGTKEAEGLFEEGWLFRAALPDGRLVVEYAAA